MITAATVKELRERTGAGMMDCKKALNETGGDMEKAIDYLREKGLSQAAKKSGRIAAEGLVGLNFSADATVGAIVEVNAETDFVAKNEEFVGLVANITETILANDAADVEALNACAYPEGGTVADAVVAKIAKIGENMNIRRFVKFAGEGTVCAGYKHGNGKIGTLVQFETAATAAELGDMGKDVAMQIASMNPQFVDESQVDPAYIEKESAILLQQALNENAESAKPKPQEIIEKMVAGRLKKELKETCLMAQAFVKDSNMSVAEYINAKAKEIGKEIKVKAFIRYEVGEGIEKKQDDLAAEVAKMTQQG